MILIIDQDQGVVERLAGMVAKLAGEATSFVETGAVASVQEAEAFLRKQEADVVIIDPAIGPVSKIVNFIRRARHTYPRIVWVLNTHNSWWKKHEARLSASPFGKRLCRYYRMSKDNTGRRAKTDFVNALVKCHHDYVLRLLYEAARCVDASRRDTRIEVRRFHRFERKCRFSERTRRRQARNNQVTFLRYFAGHENHIARSNFAGRNEKHFDPWCGADAVGFAARDTRGVSGRIAGKGNLH
jgi:hypothetical protein